MVQILSVARYSSALRPIQRIKHVIDFQVDLPVNLKVENQIALAVDTPTLGSVSSVATGSKINGFFITVESAPNETSTTAIPNIYVTIWKNPGGNLSMSGGNAIGTDDNKRYVIHQEMAMLNAVDGGTPRNIFKGVVVVPKGMRRMGPNDRWNVQYFIPSTGIAAHVCMQVHYKEFR